MTNIDIFQAGNAVQTSWFNPKEIGDAVQGTYIGSASAVDSYGNSQKVFSLRQPTGGVVNVGVKETRVMFLAQMAQISEGQIVGIKYTELLPPRKPGQNPTKILTIFANPSVRDEQWMKDQEILNSMKNNDGGVSVSDEDEGPVDASPVPANDEPFPSRALSDDEKIAQISTFAKAKLNVTDPALVRDSVMQATGLAFISANLDQILNKLRTM